MTIDEYLAYVREYQRRLCEASLLARTGLTEPLHEDETDLDALYDDEDPFPILDEPFLLGLPDPVAA